MDSSENPSIGTKQDSVYEHVWVGLVERAWYSLAIVPSTADVSARSVARGLARVGSEYLGEPMRLFSAEGFSLGGGRKLLESLSEGRLHGSIVSTDLPTDSEAALLLARHVDAVLLVVPLGRARLAVVRELVSQIGKARIVGTVTVGS